MSKHSALNTFGRSGNPAFTKNFTGSSYDLPLEQRMTLDGAVNKTGILLALCFTGGFIGWNIPALDGEWTPSYEWNIIYARNFMGDPQTTTGEGDGDDVSLFCACCK